MDMPQLQEYTVIDAHGIMHVVEGHSYDLYKDGTELVINRVKADPDKIFWAVLTAASFRNFASMLISNKPAPNQEDMVFECTPNALRRALENVSATGNTGSGEVEISAFRPSGKRHGYPCMEGREETYSSMFLKLSMPHPGTVRLKVSLP